MTAIPTRIIAEPWNETVDGRKNMMIKTDAGTFTLRDLSEIPGMPPRATIQGRLSRQNGWKTPDVLNPESYCSRWVDDSSPAEPAKPKARRKRRDPESIPV